MGTLGATDGTGVVWGKNLTSFPFAEMKIAPTPPSPNTPYNPPTPSNYSPSPSYPPSPSNPPTPAGIVYAVATRNED